MTDTRDSDRGAANLIALGSIFLGLSVITVVLRFYARRRQKAPLQADDWLTVPALVSLFRRKLKHHVAGL